MSTKLRDLAKSHGARGRALTWTDSVPRAEGEGGIELSHVYAAFDHRRQAAELFDSLPHVAADVEAHAELLARLLNVIAAQQAELAELRAEVNAVISGAVSVKMQENMAGLLRGLVEMGSDVKKPHATLQLTGAVKASDISSSGSRASSTEETSSRVDVRGEIAGLAKALAGLNVKVDLDETGTTRRLATMESRATATREESRSAKLVMTFDSIKGSPLAHARAKKLATASRRRPRKRVKKPAPERSTA